MKNFQIILTGVFIVAAVLGLLVFSGTIPLGEDNENTLKGSVVMWGTFPVEAVNQSLENFVDANPDVTLSYIQKNAQSFDQELLEALASGQGPDIFFLPDELTYHYGNKILTIPYSTYPVANFKRNFVAAGEVFLVPSGALAFPLTVDPLVMYYNRSMLDAAGIVDPPSNWGQMVNLVPRLTKKDQSNKIQKSAAALGHHSNVLHAKDILATMFMQTGSKIVGLGDGGFSSDLGAPLPLGSYSPDLALTFYTDFADPGKNIYSWNKSFPLSRDYFGTDNLAFYFGYASELATLLNRNPNQNFWVAEMPQIEGAKFKLTMGRVTGLAVSAFSRNQNTAFLVASSLASGAFASELAERLGLAPARRDLLRAQPDDSFSPIFYASALYSRSFLDPDPDATDDIFRRMIEGVLSGGVRPQDAVADAGARLNLLLR